MPATNLDPLGINTIRTLSMDAVQQANYKDAVLPPAVVARVSVEQASAIGWERYVGPAGKIIGMRTFGASAPLAELSRKFGFEPEYVVKAAKEILGRKGWRPGVIS